MTGHGPSTNWGADRASSFKSRIGVWMFILYSVFYFGFIALNVMSPRIMGSDIGGLNLAVIYGMGLIIFALMLALVYNAICTAAEEELNEPANKDRQTLEN